VILRTTGNPWCPECMAHQMVETKARICQDETTLAFCTQRTWECPTCDNAPPAEDADSEIDPNPPEGPATVTPTHGASPGTNERSTP